MSRVGFAIHGKNGDERDYFPFVFSPSPLGNEGRVVYLDFNKAFEYIHRVRTMRLQANLSCFDAAANPDEIATVDKQITGTRLISDERDILRQFRNPAGYPGWGDPEADSTYGGDTTQPLSYGGNNRFAPYLQFTFLLVVPHPDPIDNSPIQIQVLTTLGNSPDFGPLRASGVECTYMDEDVQVFEQKIGFDGETLAPPVTGTVVIEPTQWWSYSGIWNTETGQQLIQPTPRGF